jgi:hypothetical protein
LVKHIFSYPNLYYSRYNVDINIFVTANASNPTNDGAYWYGVHQVSCHLNTYYPEEQVLLEIQNINKDFTAWFSMF